MKVSELIVQLQMLPQELEVMLPCESNMDHALRVGVVPVAKTDHDWSPRNPSAGIDLQWQSMGQRNPGTWVNFSTGHNTDEHALYENPAVNRIQQRFKERSSRQHLIWA